MVKANELNIHLKNVDIEKVEEALKGFEIVEMNGFGLYGYEREYENQKGEVITATEEVPMTEAEVKAKPMKEEVEEEPKAEVKIEKVFNDVDDVEEETPKATKGTDYKAMAIADLRVEIEARGLDVRSVSKQPLVDALIEDDKGETSEEIDEVDETKEEVGSKYAGQKAMDLFKEAKDRGLDVKPRQKATFYVDILEADDAKTLAKEDEPEEEVWEDIEEDEDEWDI